MIFVALHLHSATSDTFTSSRLDLLQDEEIGKMALMVYRTFVRTGVQRLISVDMGEAKKPVYDSADYSSVYHQGMIVKLNECIAEYNISEFIFQFPMRSQGRQEKCSSGASWHFTSLTNCVLLDFCLLRKTFLA